MKAAGGKYKGRANHALSLIRGLYLIERHAKNMDFADAREKVESWREDYNKQRPHGALNNLTPEEFVENKIPVKIESFIENLTYKNDLL